MTKYMKVENSQVLSPEDHNRMEKALHRVGKTSALEFTDEELKDINEELKSS